MTTEFYWLQLKSTKSQHIFFLENYILMRLFYSLAMNLQPYFTYQINNDKLLLHPAFLKRKYDHLVSIFWTGVLEWLGCLMRKGTWHTILRRSEGFANRVHFFGVWLKLSPWIILSIPVAILTKTFLRKYVYQKQPSCLGIFVLVMSPRASCLVPRNFCPCHEPSCLVPRASLFRKCTFAQVFSL